MPILTDWGVADATPAGTNRLAGTQSDGTAVYSTITQVLDSSGLDAATIAAISTALQASDVDPDITTFALPADTTISTYMAQLVACIDEGEADVVLGLGALAHTDTVDTALIDDAAVTPPKLGVTGTPVVGRVLKITNLSPLTLTWDVDSGGASYLVTLDSADYSSAAFQVGSDGQQKNETRVLKTTTVGDHILEFTDANLDASSFGSFSKDTNTAGADYYFLGDNTGGSEVTLVVNTTTTVAENVNSPKLLGSCSWFYDSTNRIVYLFGDFDLGLGSFRVTRKEVSETTYTFLESDSGLDVVFTNANPVTVTVADTLSVGWIATWRQQGAGLVSFSEDTGTTLQNRSTHTDSAGQYATGALVVESNTDGSSAVVVLSGDTA